MLRSSLTRCLVATAAVLFFSACSSDSATAPTIDMTGLYGLESFNGRGLPFTLADTVGPDIYTLTYTEPFSITLNSDNSMEIVVTGVLGLNGALQPAADTTRGYYSVKGTEVTFSTWQGDTFWADWN